MGEEEVTSQDNGAETQGQVDESGQQSTGINPAWNDLLGSIPSSLHSVVTPHLQKWDQNYQEGIGKVHSEYESWKPFMEQGITPEQVQYGLQLLNAFETRPQDIYAAMHERFGQQQQQPQEEVDLDEQGQQSEPVDITSHPQFQQLAETVNAMAQILVQQSSQSEEQQADQELEQEFAAAKTKYGDFDEKWVMVQMLADENLTLDQAVGQYKDFEKSLLAKANQPGPKILSPGGQNPNVGTPPNQLDDKGRRQLVASMLQAGKQEQ